MNAVVAEGLVKTYTPRTGKVKALDGLDLVVPEGTVLGLLGPNGAGKTTTVRILATLLRPDAGRATVAGFDVVSQAQELRAVIGLSGQYAAVDENLTARENLVMFGRLYQLARAEARTRADELLETFALVDAAARVVKTYSGGMRRRLDLACALIGRPRILFLDEPTTGLDPRSRLAMWDAIRDRVKAGATVLLTTQYLEEADALADAIAVVDQGKIIARGTADELKARIGGERIEVVVREAADVERAAALIAPAEADRVIDARARRVTTPARSGAQQLVQVVRDLDAAGIAIDDLGLRRPTLDDVFLALTGHAAAPEATPAAGEGGQVVTSLGQAASDGLIVAGRNLRRIPRIPELAIFAIIQSIIFVLLFAFVFGGAIPLPDGGSYREFLMPGIFVQTVFFASITTAVGMTDDVNKGILDRFRSLPMARSAVLSGRALADLVYNGGILIVLMLSGLVVGWGVHTGVLEFLAGCGLMLMVTFAMSWIGVWIGLNVPSVEVANQVGFMVLFPLTFVSNIFVPPSTLPSWLQPVAEWNPVSTLTAAIRELWGNPNPYVADGIPAEHPVLVTVAWTAALLAVFVPLGVRRYRTMSR